MNFKGHAAGGILVGASMVGCLCLTGRVDFSQGIFAVHQDALFPKEGYELSRQSLFALKIFGLTFVMSLFPDLDTHSIFQRWFFRFLFFGCTLLIFQGYNDTALFLLLTGILPLLGKHRGWMHALWAPFVWILFLSIAYQMALGRFSAEFTLTGLFEFFISLYRDFTRNLWFVAAVFVGYYTHLFLDSGLFRRKKQTAA